MLSPRHHPHACKYVRYYWAYGGSEDAVHMYLFAHEVLYRADGSTSQCGTKYASRLG